MISRYLRRGCERRWRQMVSILGLGMRLTPARAIWAAVLCMAAVDLFLYGRKGAILQRCNLERLIGTKKYEAIAVMHSTGTLNQLNNISTSVEVKSSPPSIPKPNLVDCDPGIPCEYPEVVDLRIIIMTFNRNASLLKLLNSLNKLEGLENDKAIVEIWVDRDSKQNYNKGLVKFAESFNWTKGKVRTHVHKKHVGLYGQWIHTWRPPASGKEIALILEDDLSISPHSYQWLKAAHAAYGNRTDIGGYTLQSEGIPKAKGGGAFKRPAGSAFLYKLLGSWGFSPHPKIWRDFQDWFSEVRQDSSFHPYVNGLIMTAWYKGFEKRHKEDSMWTQWYIYFCEKFNVYNVWNNIAAMVTDKKDKGRCLAVNRREPGLHYGGKGVDNTASLVTAWKDEYVKFPNTPVLLEWDGLPKPH